MIEQAVGATPVFMVLTLFAGFAYVASKDEPLLRWWMTGVFGLTTILLQLSLIHLFVYLILLPL